MAAIADDLMRRADEEFSKLSANKLAQRELTERLGEVIVAKQLNVHELVKSWAKPPHYEEINKHEFRVHVRKLVTCEAAEVDALFDEVDLDHDGTFSPAEMRVSLKRFQDAAVSTAARERAVRERAELLRQQALAAKDAAEKTAEIESLRAEVDEQQVMERSGALPLRERLGFCLATQNIKTNELVLKWDDSGNGMIEKAEFRKHVAVLMGIEKQLEKVAPGGEIDQLFDELDDDHGGSLDAGEIKSALRTLQDIAKEEAQTRKAREKRYKAQQEVVKEAQANLRRALDKDAQDQREAEEQRAREEVEMAARLEREEQAKREAEEKKVAAAAAKKAAFDAKVAARRTEAPGARPKASPKRKEVPLMASSALASIATEHLRLSEEELLKLGAAKTLAERLGAVLVAKQVKVSELVATWAKRGEDEINKMEFRQQVRKLTKCEASEVDALFATLDADGSGTLEVGEIKASLKRFQEAERGTAAREKAIRETGERHKQRALTAQSVAELTEEVEGIRAFIEDMRAQEAAGNLPLRERLGQALISKNLTTNDVLAKWEGLVSRNEQIDKPEFRENVLKLLESMGLDKGKGMKDPKRLAEINSLFDEMDEDKGGFLDRKEIRATLVAMMETATENKQARKNKEARYKAQLAVVTEAQAELRLQLEEDAAALRDEEERQKQAEEARVKAAAEQEAARQAAEEKKQAAAAAKKAAFEAKVAAKRNAPPKPSRETPPTSARSGGAASSAASSGGVE